MSKKNTTNATFTETQSLQVGTDRKAGIDENGVYHNAIGLESTEEHPHVAKAWQDRCFPFNELYANVQADVPSKRDESVPESSVAVTSALNLDNGYILTGSGLSTLRSFTDIPSKMQDYLISNGYNADFARFLNDGLEMRRNAWANKDNAPRNFLLRIRDEDKVRAVCSDRYGILDNADVMDLIARALPGGYSDALCSHMHNDGDNLGGNILLPQYIKSNPDSDYGFGLAFRNSEVRESTFCIGGFLFRAICFNGNIWSRKDSTIKVNQKHLGKIDKDDLFQQVQKAVMVALTEGENLLVQLGYTKEVKVNDPLRLIASLARDNGLSIEQGRAWHKGYQDSLMEVGGDVHENAAFGIINGLTLAAQRFDYGTKTDMETLSGNLITPSLDADLDAVTNRWNKYQTRAEMLDAKIINKYAFASA